MRELDFRRERETKLETIDNDIINFITLNFMVFLLFNFHVILYYYYYYCQ